MGRIGYQTGWNGRQAQSKFPLTSRLSGSTVCTPGASFEAIRNCIVELRPLSWPSGI